MFSVVVCCTKPVCGCFCSLFPNFTGVNSRQPFRISYPSSKVKVIDFDSRIEPGDINEKVFGQLTRLSPFGSGNETPIFVCTKLKIVEAKTLTSGKHLKLKVSDPDSKQWINVNAWRKGYLAEHLKEGSLIDLAFTMSIDDWQGRKSLTLTTVDIKPHVK